MRLRPYKEIVTDILQFCEVFTLFTFKSKYNADLDFRGSVFQRRLKVDQKKHCLVCRGQMLQLVVGVDDMVSRTPCYLM